MTTTNDPSSHNHCIEWTGALNSGGYPVMWKDGKNQYVHRVLMGATDNEIVLHTCDNPKCVNPLHLRIGTHKENSQDMVNKNRQAVGEQCGNSKLKEEDVQRIRLLQGQLSSRKVAVLFDISKTNVLDIWRKNIWNHL